MRPRWLEIKNMRLSILALSVIGVMSLALPSRAQANHAVWRIHKSDKATLCLEQVSNPKKVLDFLQHEFPDVRIPRRIRPGTSRERGYRKDIASFLQQARAMGLIGAEKPWNLQVFHVVHGDADEITMLLSTLVPDVIYAVDGTDVIALGPHKALSQARELLVELDQPLDQVLTDVRLVEFTSNTIPLVNVIWRSVPARETHREYVNGIPLARRTKSKFSPLRVGRFTRSH